MRKSTGNNSPVRPFAPRTSGKGGPTGNSAKLRKIAAPKPPANASMSGTHGKLRKGDC